MLLITSNRIHREFVLTLICSQRQDSCATAPLSLWGLPLRLSAWGGFGVFRSRVLLFGGRSLAE